MMRLMSVFILLLAFAGATGAQVASTVPTSPQEISLSFAPVVKKAAPAVVNIYAKRVTQGRQTPFMNDPFFDQFFRGFDAPRPRVQSSLGSGVILSPDGIMVSNYHVVGMATEIRVVLTDGTEYEARVLLGDEESDLAILQLAGAEDLPYLALRDSDSVEVGELTLAIGNPFGVGQTVSSGIISGLARSGGAGGAGRGYFIQTDAPINPGNSGGALVDTGGRVIGINTQIVSRSGGSNGIGFAIPANLVRSFVEQARAGATEFARPWAGMAGQAVDFDMAASLGLDRVGGMVISALHEESPFVAAGFQVGDVITQVDGLEVNAPSEMIYRMSVRGLGQTSSVTFERDGKRREVEVALIAAPDQPARDMRRFAAGSRFPGLTVALINPAVIAEMGLAVAAKGTVVMGVEGPAARTGLRRGDIIEGLNGVVTPTPRTFDQALQSAGRLLELTLNRQGKRISLRLRS